MAPSTNCNDARGGGQARFSTFIGRFSPPNPFRPNGYTRQQINENRTKKLYNSINRSAIVVTTVIRIMQQQHCPTYLPRFSSSCSELEILNIFFPKCGQLKDQATIGFENGHSLQTEFKYWSRVLLTYRKKIDANPAFCQHV